MLQEVGEADVKSQNKTKNKRCKEEPRKKPRKRGQEQRQPCCAESKKLVVGRGDDKLCDELGVLYSHRVRRSALPHVSHAFGRMGARAGFLGAVSRNKRSTLHGERRSLGACDICSGDIVGACAWGLGEIFSKAAGLQSGRHAVRRGLPNEGLQGVRIRAWGGVALAQGGARAHRVRRSTCLVQDWRLLGCIRAWSRNFMARGGLEALPHGVHGRAVFARASEGGVRRVHRARRARCLCQRASQVESEGESRSCFLRWIVDRTDGGGQGVLCRAGTLEHCRNWRAHLHVGHPFEELSNTTTHQQGHWLSGRSAGQSKGQAYHRTLSHTPRPRDLRTPPRPGTGTQARSRSCTTSPTRVRTCPRDWWLVGVWAPGQTPASVRRRWRTCSHICRPSCRRRRLWCCLQAWSAASLFAPSSPSRRTFTSSPPALTYLSPGLTPSKSDPLTPHRAPSRRESPCATV
eukprot:m.320953 g.320953  ORF g.320953 m.320953 type:complete len:461 (+) comp55512_c0_seq2:69-1451(+)